MTQHQLPETISATTQSDVVISFPSEFGNYKYLSTIGSGATSVVIHTMNIKTHEFSATKIVSRADLVSRDLFSSFEQELRVQQNLDHPNIVKILDVVYGEENIYVVMEYCGNGDLFEWAQRGIYSNQSVLRKTFYQLLSAVYYMHKKNIAHLDLKPENVLLDSNFNVKLTDFGCCETEIPKNTKEFYGTLYYTAPEIFSGVVHDFDKSDMFSLGVILYALVTGCLPWANGTDDEIKENIIQCNYIIPPYVPREICQVINGCLVPDPNDRISIDDAFQLPWMLEEKKRLEMETKKKSVQISKTTSTPFVGNLTLKKPVTVRPEVARITPVLARPAARSVGPRKLNSSLRFTYSEGQLPKLTLKKDQHQSSTPKFASLY